MNPQVYHKHIAEPYFSFLIDGQTNPAGKTHEGRVNVGDWAKMKVGDIIYANNGQRRTFKAKITEIVKADDFGELFKKLKSNLLPNAKTQAIKIYSQWSDPASWKKFGVLGVKLEIIPN